MEAHWVLNGKPNRLDKILKKKYKIAIAEDEILYESLKTNDGRTKYWEALWHDALKSDLVSLFEEKPLSSEYKFLGFCD